MDIKKLSTDNRGFTLVEVIVVLLILGILSAIALPSMSGYIDRAMDQRARTHVEYIRRAVQIALLEVDITELNEVIYNDKTFSSSYPADMKVYNLLKEYLDGELPGEYSVTISPKVDFIGGSGEKITDVETLLQKGVVIWYRENSTMAYYTYKDGQFARGKPTDTP